jgi:hypothetical protein
VFLETGAASIVLLALSYDPLLAYLLRFGNLFKVEISPLALVF